MLCHVSAKNRETCRSLGLAVLRLALGIVFLTHGWMKLTGGPAQFAKLLENLSVPLPLFAAWVVTLVELVGGLTLLLGIGTRLAGSLIAVNMLVAMLLVHWKNGFFISPQAVGYEYVFTLMLGALTLALTGAGRYALDALICRGCAAREGEPRSTERAAREDADSLQQGAR